jgi:hypothetical protein
MTTSSTVLAGLGRDVTIGGLTSPLLSWLAAGALLVFFGWQVVRLLTGVARASAPFAELHPLLTSLAEDVEASDLSRSYERAWSIGRTSPRDARTALDFDRLTRLDTSMRESDALRRPWIQLRKTLLIEHVSWFKEPRIFSTRRAEEFFTPEAVLSPSLDLGYFAQVPSLLTGFGLLMTFVAICLGLSRLHADGTTISGIQGLVNGLAGKFLTSIVALVCANVFVLLERPAVGRLLARHREFVALLDESFPRRTPEDLLDALARQHALRPTAGAGVGVDDDGTASLDVLHRLAASIDTLNSVVRALAVRLDASEDPGAIVGAHRPTAWVPPSLPS